MTCIAYRNGVLAADGAMVTGGCIIGTTVKISRNKKGDLCGAAGEATFNGDFLRWFKNGEKGKFPVGIDTHDNCDRAVIFRAAGTIEVYEGKGHFPITAEYYAMGSGRPEALGAMHAGATALEAVQAAVTHDLHCGLPITVLRHVELKPIKYEPFYENEPGILKNLELVPGWAKINTQGGNDAVRWAKKCAPIIKRMKADRRKLKAAARKKGKIK